MKKAQVQVGHIYAVKVSGKVQPVRIERASPYGGWEGRNVRTNRAVRIHTAAKCRAEVDAKGERLPAPKPAPAPLGRPRAYLVPAMRAPAEIWHFQCPENGLAMFARYSGGKLEVAVADDIEVFADEPHVIADAEAWAKPLCRYFDDAADARTALRCAGVDLD